MTLQVNGFLDLQTVTGAALGAVITQGLACIVVAYFLAVFALIAFVDYAAWKFRRERFLIKPYLELITMLEAHVSVTGEQVKNATTRIPEPETPREIVAGQVIPGRMEHGAAVQETLGQLRAISGSLSALYTEMQPLLKHWAATVSRATNLSWQLRARLLAFGRKTSACPLL